MTSRGTACTLLGSSTLRPPCRASSAAGCFPLCPVGAGSQTETGAALCCQFIKIVFLVPELAEVFLGCHDRDCEFVSMMLLPGSEYGEGHGISHKHLFRCGPVCLLEAMKLLYVKY